MCMSCGCGEADADHGDPRHITTARLNEAGGVDILSQEMLQGAADAAEIPVEEVLENIRYSVKG